jgi:protein-tyrosine phosphatase
VSDSPAEERYAEQIVRLASADNFRDVAGPDTPYVAADGVPLRRGVLYRSNELQLSDADAAQLADLGIGAIFDLRHQSEIDAHPDVEVPGATWEHLEVKGIPMDEVADLEGEDAGTQVMHRVYRGFVERPGAREAFATLLTRIATSDQPQVFHCTAGKDRTGWSAALLLHLAGVDQATILDDYLLTNRVSTATRDKYLAMVAEHLGPEKVPVYEAVMVVEESYLQTAYDAVTELYGDLDGYLRDGLGLGDDVLAAVRRRLRD